MRGVCRSAVAAVVTVLLLTWPQHCHANYAQLGGEKKQNIARQVRSPFEKLWGHAVVTIPGDEHDNPDLERRDFGLNRVMVLGGDNYDIDTGTGELTNAVWYTQNIGWRVVESLTDRTHYGALFPKIVSSLQWASAVPAGTVEPVGGFTYRQYLCCETTPLADMWPCRDVAGSPFVCDPFLGERRWSPRRDLQALSIGRRFDGRVLVLGGRARFPNEDAPDTWTIGGAIPDDEFAVRREPSTLTNDVWLSVDNRGSTWRMRTPGCGVHTQQFMGRGDVYCDTTDDCIVTHRLGTNGTQPNGTVSCVDHTCVCNIWTPRERFSAAVLNPLGDVADIKLFVAGGITEVTRQKCGEFACGGGNRIFLNDVWRSDDLGLSWVEVARHDESARWRPRGDHAMIIVRGVLWLLGGRGGNVAQYAENPLMSDVWVSPDMGATWTRRRHAAEWAPRAGHVAAFDDIRDEVLLFGGERFVMPSPSPTPLAPRDEVVAAAAAAPVPSLYGTPIDDALVVDTSTLTEPEARALAMAAREALANARDETTQEFVSQEFVHGDMMRVMDDTWILSNASGDPGGTWLTDYTAAVGNDKYIWPTSLLTHPTLNYTADFIAALNNAGLYTLQEFAHALADVIVPLKGAVGEDELCLQKARAEKISYTCENRYEPYDGEFINSIVIVEGNAGRAPPTREEVVGCASPLPNAVPEELTDVECRQQPMARHGAAVTVVYDRVMVMGGYTSALNLHGDLWYRDVVPPVTSITTFPESGSSDTVFEFLATECRIERSCVYEYRLFDEEKDRLMRNWSRHTSPLDYRKFLDGGVYRFQVRGIDAAGNRDQLIEQGRNMHVWRYTPPLPWLLIILAILLFIIICIAIFVWYRRRKRRLALERYALKRARRKLKAAKAGDWRNHYNAGGAKKKRKRKKREGRSKSKSKKSKSSKSKSKKGKKSKSSGKKKSSRKG